MEAETHGAPRRFVIGFLLLFAVVDVAILAGGARQLWRVHERDTRGVIVHARILDTRWDEGHLRVHYMYRLKRPDGTARAETAIALVEKARAKAYAPGGDTRAVVVQDDPTNADLADNPQQTTGAWGGIGIALLQLVFVGIFAGATLRRSA